MWKPSVQVIGVVLIFPSENLDLLLLICFERVFMGRFTECVLGFERKLRSSVQNLEFLNWKV